MALFGAVSNFFRNLLPHKGDGLKETARKIAVILSAVVFISSAVVLSCYYIKSLQNRNIAQGIAQMHKSGGSKGKTPRGMLPEFTSLLQKNADTKGWISIPGTNVNFPVVQAKDNAEYLTVDFYKQPNRYGNPFLDCRDSILPESQNLIIYGHNMNDDQMFHEITKYKNADFYNTSPIITFDTLYQSGKWKIFAGFITTADSTKKGSINYLVTNFDSDSVFMNFVAEVKKRSVINTQVDVRPGDTLLTLSTCTYEVDSKNWRFVLMARGLRPGEDDTVGPATHNANALYPDLWYKTFGGKPPV